MCEAGGVEPRTGALPLEGVRVLDLTIVWAGPYCTSFLADMGAEVIRIESTQTFPPAPTRGARARPNKQQLDDTALYLGGLPGRVPGARPWNRIPLFNAHARNKLSMTVDLLRPEGQEVLDRLVAVSDVFVENNPTRTMERLSISYERLSAINPRIIMLRMPAYGNSGPYKNHRGFGLHMDSVVGHTMLRGYADMDVSSVTPVLVCDAAGGTHGAFAVLAALNHLERTGEGQLIELAQAEAFIPMLGAHFMDYSMNGRNGGTRGNRHPHAIQGCYPCEGSDRWVVVTLYDEQDWRRFIAALGEPAWTRDAAFADHESRLRNQDGLDVRIAEWTSERGHVDVMEALQAAGVAAGAVLDQADAYADTQLRESGFFQEAHQEDTGTHLYPGAPYRRSGAYPRFRRGPVRLGEDNEYVYKRLLGYSDDEYARLEAEGHVGMDYDESIE